MSLSEYSRWQEKRDRPGPSREDLLERFQALAEESADVIWLLTPDGEMQEVSSSWQIFSGQRAGVASGRGWTRAVHPADRANIKEVLGSVVRSGRTVKCDCYLRRADTSYHFMRIRAIPIRTATGAVREIMMCGTEMANQGLTGEMNGAQIEFALQVSRTGMWNWNLLTHQLAWTDQCRALFGVPPGEPLTHGLFLTLLHPEDRERIAQITEQTLAEQKEFHTEYRIIWPDGSLHWLADRGRGVYDSRGRPIGMIGVVMDITDLKQAEEALCESERRFRRFVESNIIGITIDDMEGNIHEANDAFLNLVGYTRADLEAGRLRWTTLTAPEYRERNAHIIEDLLMTGSFSPVETAYITREGRRVPALVGGTLFRTGDPRALGMCFILDLTARKAIEEQKDLFLSITSHELKTPLTALKGLLQLLQRRAERLSRAGEKSSAEISHFLKELTHNLEISIRQVDVQTRLINDLLDVSRITANTLELSLCQSDLTGILRQVVEDIRVTEPGRVILLELPEAEVNVRVDADRLSQVVTNYLTNALRYSPSDQPVQVGLTVREREARVWVRDRGPGLSEEEQRAIWQRFHRGKRGASQGSNACKGLGLGLYIAQRLIAQHGGQVGVESAPGEGSTFWFTLPLL